MIDSSRERDLWWLERVVGGKVDGEEEDPSLVGTLWWAHDGGHPLIDVVAFGSSRAVGWGVQANFSQLFLNSLRRTGQLRSLHGDQTSKKETPVEV